jgi:ribonuclease BN (tRNA processing enzyme)
MPREIDRDTKKPEKVLDGEIRIDALPVPHGIVPALGFRVSVGDVSIVFASDQNGSSAAFTDFAGDASVLVMHVAVPEDATGTALQLHARPSRIASVAAEAGAGTLVLSHFMARSLRDLDGNVDVVRRGYDGNIVVANDLDCVVVSN